MLPDFDENGNLPPGQYVVNTDEIFNRFTWNNKRKKLYEGLVAALKNLAEAGVMRVWLNGSFVTAKDEPADIDGCWEPNPSVDADKLDPVFLDLNPPRTAMKAKYGVDFLVAWVRIADGGNRYVQDFFQEDRNGNAKGILVVELRKGQ